MYTFETDINIIRMQISNVYDIELEINLLFHESRANFHYIKDGDCFITMNYWLYYSPLHEYLPIFTIYTPWIIYYIHTNNTDGDGSSNKDCYNH